MGLNVRSMESLISHLVRIHFAQWEVCEKYFNILHYYIDAKYIHTIIDTAIDLK